MALSQLFFEVAFVARFSPASEFLNEHR
jgi:hypothetical protein